jgi:hypothetical protein
MTSLSDLSDSIRFLRHAAPEEFERFRQAFAGYSNDARDKLVQGVDKLEVLQGHAQQCKEILRLLGDGDARGR